MLNCVIKIIRDTLDDNGFKELPSGKDLLQNISKNQPSAVAGAFLHASKDVLNMEATVIWYVCSIKKSAYQTLQKY